MLNQNIVSAQTKILGIIGHPISHSMSPVMHNIALSELNLDYVYLAFDVLPKNLENALKGMKALNIKGINITIPFKESVIPYLDIIDPLAQKIGAVNTIKLQDDIIYGKNTDAAGFKKSLSEAQINPSGLDVLLLGSGGAARAISYTLIDSINRLAIINRKKQNAEQLVSRLKKESNSPIVAKKLTNINLKSEIKIADLLINATPVGMYPSQHDSIINPNMLHRDLTVIDLVYNPLETQLIKDAKIAGCKTLNGLDMLINQGSLAFEWWTNKKPNTSLMKRKIIELLS
ncbi:MAG: shikimate dehydrogenase [Promethearchaeota archaeon]|nr:MAG: shikimate dehydrogenase [Candidatus Lokiarchaeota archaeon]